MRQGLVMVMGAGFALLAFAPGAARAQTREVSRSAPIVATIPIAGGVEAQYQGSFVVVTPAPPVPTFNGAADAATFEFPYIKGHLRAVATTEISAIAERFEDLIALFDAANGIPLPQPAGAPCVAYFTDACRTVFTTVAAPDATGLAQRPNRIFFDIDPANVSLLKPLLAPTLTDPEVATLIDFLLQGTPDGLGGRVPGLGGVDRSTLAIIEHSVFIPQIAGEDRPTMIYVGALDGMLHAICAEVRGPCTAAGQELWAFIPRTQLGLLRLNAQRVDGSVKVADVFDDFDLADPAVVREWKTVLTMQTGSGDTSNPDLAPSVLAIDVSNPADPQVLWERSTPASPAALDQGVGLGLAMGLTRMAGQMRNFTFVETNNGGSSATAGFFLAAIDTSKGETAWEFKQLYPAPRTGGNPAVPDTGIPGGAAAFDLDRAGLVTHVAFTTLYGDLFVKPADGTPGAYVVRPIFRFSNDFQPIGAPPTIYFDLSTGRTNAVVVSGGYADPVAATWVQPGDDHFAVSVVVDPQPVNVPMDEVTTGYGGDRVFVRSLGPGNRATGQALVAGNELFVTTDTTDVNLSTYGEVANTGSLTRYSLTDGTQKGSAITIAGGASATDVTATGTVHVGSAGGAMKVDVGTTGGGGAFDANGAPIERKAEDNNPRLLWLNG